MLSVLHVRAIYAEIELQATCSQPAHPSGTAPWEAITSSSREMAVLACSLRVCLSNNTNNVNIDHLTACTLDRLYSVVRVFLYTEPCLWSPLWFLVGLTF